MGNCSKSSSSRMTIRPSSASKPLASWSQATSSPQDVQMRRILIRPPSAAWTWWNRRSCSCVAEYSLTGTLTSPKDTAPFHIARIAGMVVSLPRRPSWAWPP
jgi:hypothetical protein